MTLVKVLQFKTQYTSNNSSSLQTLTSSNSYYQQHKIYSHIYSLKLTLLIKFLRTITSQLASKIQTKKSTIQNKHNLLYQALLTSKPNFPNFVCCLNKFEETQPTMDQIKISTTIQQKYQLNFAILIVRIANTFASQKDQTFKLTKILIKFLNSRYARIASTYLLAYLVQIE
ncbi:hypothetical protein ABPG74_006170 [Tetrahymena malaccensis]